MNSFILMAPTAGAFIRFEIMESTFMADFAFDALHENMFCMAV